MNKILRVFTDIDMRNQHTGLKTLCDKVNVKLDDLLPGEHVVFINSAKNKVKVYSASGVLSYMRRKIDLAAIEMIPQSFQANGTLSWAKAEKKALERKLMVH